MSNAEARDLIRKILEKVYCYDCDRDCTKCKIGELFKVLARWNGEMRR